MTRCVTTIGDNIYRKVGTMITNKQIAMARHNASLKRHADIFTGCLKAGTLKQVQKKIKPLQILKKMNNNRAQ